MGMFGKGFERFLKVNTDPDQTANYNTPLSAAQEQAFQRWRSRLPQNLQSLQDYDLRGAWKANAQAAANGHLPDTWKKPNHPTFSDGSIYDSPYTPAGHWSELPGRHWQFQATPQDLKYRSLDDLLGYFRQVEPGNTLVPPR
jgi:hypothetical protein